MLVNEYIKYINKEDKYKIYNIATNDTIAVDCDTLTSIVKLIGIKQHSITFYI